jgi:hypothetical protein
MENDCRLNDKISALMAKGVNIPCPYGVEIAADVDVNRISGQGVVFHGGIKIIGSKTLIGSGVILGYEAPLTIVNCRVGSGTELKGGFCEDSLFLSGVSMASGVHVREGCILEENVRAGHTVGLKQTILFPFVTLGSLINFCDCLMAGGTSRKNHSEVGSSYIHFNYTPHQDKATPSLIGDVPRGTMVNQPPIFLGGQGGMVGPTRVGYGVIVPAGATLRRDLSDGERPNVDEFSIGKKEAADPRRKIRNNVIYMANLLALRQWYREVRRLFFEKIEFGAEMQTAAAEIIDTALEERLRRLEEFLNVPGPPNLLIRRYISSRCHKYVESKSADKIALDKKDRFLRIIEDRRHRDGAAYLRVIQGLSRKEASLGTAWLQAIVDDAIKRILDEQSGV